MKKINCMLIIIFTYILLLSCNKNESINKLPSCSIINPSNSEEIEKGSIVNISIEAIDEDGKINEVRIYLNDSMICALNVSPYIYYWNTAREEIGDYKIKATAIDDSRAENSDEIDVILMEGGFGKKPTSDFEASLTIVKTGETIQFYDLSTNNPNSWNWDFGDGDSSNSQNPTHSYLIPGNFSVSLKATNGSGSDTEMKLNYIIVNSIEPETGTITDIDGNIYNTIKIGNQWWMSENLKTTRFPNGTKIPVIEDSSAWRELDYNDTALCYYDNSLTNLNIYGALYTWTAANEACPTGWHLPSDSEWKELEMHIGMPQDVAEKTGYRGTNEGTKLAGYMELWADGDLKNNDASFGISKFLALPAGRRNNYGSFLYLGESATFYSATVEIPDYAWVRYLDYSMTEVNRVYNYKTFGRSVRCIMD